MLPLIILIGIVVVLLPVFVYNNLVRKRNAVDNAFYSMDVMLKKRYDLIPMLVETVKGYTTHEKEILVQLAEIRQKLTGGTGSINEKVGMDNEFGTIINQILLTAENYPSLKAGENFLRLQGAINETEEQLAASRRFYNAAVNDYHDAIQSFPGSIIAGWAGMHNKNYFVLPDQEQSIPSTGFNL